MLEYLIDRFKALEAWVNNKTETHPGWNVLTWLGHAAGVALCVAIAAIPMLLRLAPTWELPLLGDLLAALRNCAGDHRSYGATFGIGFITIRELVDQFVRKKKAPASWSKVWRVFDPVMDVASAWAAGIGLSLL